MAQKLEAGNAPTKERIFSWFHERKSKRLLGFLNKDDIKKVEKQRTFRADAIVILGGDETLVVDKAAKLYKKGYAPRIVFISEGGTSGGVFTNPKTGETENEYQHYRRRLVELGVYESDIISPETVTAEQTENLANNDVDLPTTNTGLEAKHIVPVVEEVTGKKPEKLILVSRQFHSRRVRATFAKENEGVELISTTSGEKHDLRTDLDYLVNMYGEIPRLFEYSEKGFLVMPEIPIAELYAWIDGVGKVIKALEKRGTEKDKGQAEYLRSWHTNISEWARRRYDRN